MAIKQQQDMRRYTTSGGIEIELSPVPPLQAEMVRNAAQAEAEELYGKPVRPTYRTEMDEELPHDETTITDERTSAEDKAAWDKWVETSNKVANHVGQATIKFFLYHGVKTDPDANKTWEAEQRFFKIPIPEDPIERKIHYIQTQLIFSREDMENITSRIMSLGGVRAEVVDAAVSSFRS